VVTCDIESTLLGRHVASDECDWYVDVEQYSALQAVHVVVPIDSAVIATGLIGERQFLNEAVLCQEMERSVDRAIGDPRVASPHTLENFSGSEMPFRRPDFI
jgi:hypothetical protein